MANDTITSTNIPNQKLKGTTNEFTLNKITIGNGQVELIPGAANQLTLKSGTNTHTINTSTNQHVLIEAGANTKLRLRGSIRAADTADLFIKGTILDDNIDLKVIPAPLNDTSIHRILLFTGIGHDTTNLTLEKGSAGIGQANSTNINTLVELVQKGTGVITAGVPSKQDNPAMALTDLNIDASNIIGTTLNLYRSEGFRPRVTPGLIATTEIGQEDRNNPVDSKKQAELRKLLAEASPDHPAIPMWRNGGRDDDWLIGRLKDNAEHVKEMKRQRAEREEGEGATAKSTATPKEKVGIGSGR